MKGYTQIPGRGLKLGQVQSFDQLLTNCNCNWSLQKNFFTTQLQLVATGCKKKVILQKPNWNWLWLVATGHNWFQSGT